MSDHTYQPDVAVAPETELEGAYEHGHELEHEHGHVSDHVHEAGGAEPEQGQAQDPESVSVRKKAPRLPFLHRSKSGVAKWKRETRFGLAALLSFVILVSVLLVNKGAKKGIKPPPLAIASNSATSSDSSNSKSESAPAAAPKDEKSEVKGPAEKRDSEKEKKNETPPAPASETPLPDFPTSGAAVPPLTDAKVLDAGAEGTLPPMSGSDQNPPLPPLVGQTGSGTGMDTGKGNEPALPQPAAPGAGSTALDASDNPSNMPSPAEVVPNPAPAPGSTPTSDPTQGAEANPSPPTGGPDLGNPPLPTDAGTDLMATGNPPVPNPTAPAEVPSAATPAPSDISAPAEPALPTTMPEPNAPTDSAPPLGATPDASAPPQPTIPEGGALAEPTAAPGLVPGVTAPPDGAVLPAQPSDATAPTPDQGGTPPPQQPGLGTDLAPSGAASASSTEPAAGASVSAPAQTPNPAPAPADAGTPTVRPAEEVPTFAQAPSSDDAMALSSTPPEIKPGEGIPIPNAGKGLSLEDDLSAAIAPAASAVGVSTAATIAGAGEIVAKAETEEVAPDPLAPELHVVQSGENFWTISKDYYGSGRYYKALWKANSRSVSAPEQLTVGQTIVVPPAEALDSKMITAPAKSNSSASRGNTQIRKTSRSQSQGNRAGETAAQPPAEVELMLPLDNSMLTRRSRMQSTEEVDPPPAKRYRAARPRYKVRAHETLRSIARETLNDPHRDEEIFELNREILDDDRRNLVEGQILELPEDARVGRQSQ